MNLPNTFTYEQQHAALAALGITSAAAQHIRRLDMTPGEIKVTFYLTRDGRHYLAHAGDDEPAQSEAVISIVGR